MTRYPENVEIKLSFYFAITLSTLKICTKAINETVTIPTKYQTINISLKCKHQRFDRIKKILSSTSEIWNLRQNNISKHIFWRSFGLNIRARKFLNWQLWTFLTLFEDHLFLFRRTNFQQYRCKTSKSKSLQSILQGKCPAWCHTKIYYKYTIKCSHHNPEINFDSCK